MLDKLQSASRKGCIPLGNKYYGRLSVHIKSLWVVKSLVFHRAKCNSESSVMSGLLVGVYSGDINNISFCSFLRKVCRVSSLVYCCVYWVILDKHLSAIYFHLKYTYKYQYLTFNYVRYTVTKPYNQTRMSALCCSPKMIALCFS